MSKFVANEPISLLDYLPSLGKFLLAITLISVGIAGYTGNLYWMVTPFVLLTVLLPFLSIKYFFWAFILLLPLSVDWEVGGSTILLPNEPLMIGILFVIILLFILNRRFFPKQIFYNSLMFIILLQFIWTLVSVYYAHDHILALKFLASKMWFLASFLLFPLMMIREKADFKKLFLFLSIPFILHAGVAFILHYFSGFGYFESNTVVQPFYRNHVDYGAVISMIIPMVFIAFLLNKGRKKRQFFIIGILLFLFVAVYFSYSRASILAAIFGFIMMYAVRLKLVNWVLPIFFAFILTFISLLVSNNKYLDFRPNMAQNATQETFIQTVTGAFTGKDMSSMERFYRWIASVRMVKDHPWVGVGPNNWYDHYKPHAVTSFRTWVSRNEEKSTTHNYFILMVTEQGIPAMLLYGVFLFVFFAKGQKVYYRFKDPFYQKITLGVIMIMAGSFVNNFFSELIETHKVGAFYYFAIAALILLDWKSKNENKNIQNISNESSTN